MHNPAITQVNIDETLANRWSGRAYDAAKSVSAEQITALLEAARWAPSCFGDQPWRFVVWDKNADAQSWQQAFDCLAPSNQSWVKDSSVLFLVCADSLFNHNQQPNRWAQYDTGAAAENLCLQASSMGLMAHQMGGFNVDLTRDKFSIPAQFTPMAMVCVGFAADIATVTGEALARETAARSRRPLNELFFANSWGQSINK
ncbi:nitroreductase family protein [Methylotenera sp.]|uniref:nitroreductase family protein n=1 Tax=Methylotenera sp. TaxID=2051956 RepID=UPI00248779FE|nr:nitroreductase family protein [Methylotenera sp.]MDI1298027.1 nitroreductase family protein [Methylotenera sp.]